MEGNERTSKQKFGGLPEGIYGRIHKGMLGNISGIQTISWIIFMSNPFFFFFERIAVETFEGFRVIFSKRITEIFSEGIVGEFMEKLRGNLWKLSKGIHKFQEHFEEYREEFLMETMEEMLKNQWKFY